MLSTRPDWFRIVSDYNPRWNPGPTIPFVFGAVRDPMGEPPPSRLAAQAELYALLKRIDTEARPIFGVRLQPCPIAGLVLVPDGTSFTWDQHELDDVVTVESLAARLWGRYGDTICAAEYSLNGHWHRFTPSERTSILNALV